MEVSYKGHVKEIVTAAWLGGVPVAEIWMNGEKLYPIDSDVVTELVVDVGLTPGSAEWLYWVHALDYHETIPEEEEIVEYGEWELVGSYTKNSDELKAEEEKLKKEGWDTKIE